MFHSRVLPCTSRLLTGVTVITILADHNEVPVQSVCLKLTHLLIPVVPAVAKVTFISSIIQVLSINPRTVAMICTILVVLFTINLVSSVY